MQKKVKVAVVGAGSFVFGPAVLQQICEFGLSDVELVLMDVDSGVLELMAAVGERMVREAGLQTQISATTKLASALDGADFVVCCAAPQMRSRHEIDRTLIQRHYPETPITEFGGLAGLSYSLRQMAFVRELAVAMKQHCPNAWLLSVSNPLPRVCQAAHETGIKTAGFCYYALAVYHKLLSILDLPPEPFPWTEARRKFVATIGGLNHFSWICELNDGDSNADLMPRLRSALEEGRTAGNPRCEAVSRRTGYFLIGADDHVASDFLAPENGVTPGYHSPFHGNDEDRRERLQSLREYSVGEGSVAAVTKDSAWEKPLEFLAGLAFGYPASFPTLNLINEGQIPNLPREVFVQTACDITGSTLQPQSVTLPETVLPYCENVAAVTAAIVRAGRTREKRAILDVIDLDPTIVDKTRGRLVANDILEAHADVIGTFR